MLHPRSASFVTLLQKHLASMEMAVQSFGLYKGVGSHKSPRPLGENPETPNSYTITCGTLIVSLSIEP